MPPMMLLPTSPCLSCSSEDVVTSSGDEISLDFKKHGIGRRHLLIITAFASLLLIGASAAGTFKKSMEGGRFLAMHDHHASGHPHAAAHHPAVNPHPAAHVARVDERAERRTTRRVIHHAEKHSSGSSGSAPGTTSLPPCPAPAAPDEGEKDEADIEMDSEPLENSAVVALPNHAVGHPHPATHHPAVHSHSAAHVARVDERAERRTTRRVIHHAEKHSSGSSGSNSDTTSSPPCQVMEDPEVDEEVAIGEDSEVEDSVSEEDLHDVQDGDSKSVLV